MFRLAASIAVLCFASLGAAAEFEVEQYEFSWKVATSGDALLSVTKEQDRAVRIEVHSRRFSDWMYLSPADAESLGTLLSKVDEHYDRLKDSTVKAESTLTSGKLSVRFSQDPEFGFSVLVSNTERLFSNRLSLDRQQCKDLAPHLLKSKAMAKHVDELVTRALNP